MGLGTVGKDMIPATVTTARLTTWHDPLFATQPIQFAGNCRIQGSIHAENKALLRGNGKTDPEFPRVHTRIALLNQMHRSPIFQGDFRQTTMGGTILNSG
jgi:hypothetical protein